MKESPFALALRMNRQSNNSHSTHRNNLSGIALSVAIGISPDPKSCKLSSCQPTVVIVVKRGHRLIAVAPEHPPGRRTKQLPARNDLPFFFGSQIRMPVSGLSQLHCLLTPSPTRSKLTSFRLSRSSASEEGDSNGKIIGVNHVGFLRKASRVALFRSESASSSVLSGRAFISLKMPSPDSLEICY